MPEERKQPRNPERSLVQITAVRNSFAAEVAVAENVSSGGLRLATERFWEPGCLVVLQSLAGKAPARAQVVYCQRVSTTAFAVGVNLLTQTTDLEEGNDSLQTINQNSLVASRPKPEPLTEAAMVGLGMRYKPASFPLNQESVVESYKAAALQFIFTELDSARVFYEMALTTGDNVRAFANAKNAHAAIRAALRATKCIRARLSQAEHRAISERMTGLKLLFERLQSKCSRETRVFDETATTSDLSSFS